MVKAKAVPTVPNLDYKIMSLQKVTVSGSDVKPLVAKVTVADKVYNTTPRFWTSFMATFGFSDSIFRYFRHQEVLDRICEKKPDAELRFCLDPDREVALAVSNPKKAVLSPNNFLELARKYKGSDVQYASGVVLSTYIPPSGERDVKIGPDAFANRFVVETPLDGYGKPSIYLSLLRQICSNGMVAFAPAFRQDIILGDDPGYAVSRALESFDSDEGYSAVRQRFEAAQKTKASLWECRRLFQSFQKMNKNGPILKQYEKVVGDIHGEYGVANFDAFVEKRLRLMPAKCRVYDLLNLASEVSTHHADGADARSLQGWLGSIVSDEFDLEGASEKPSDFEGVFIPETKTRSGRGRPGRRGAN